jgi:arylsulfatase A-like enzyme/Flp pilus assembly protein TadD
MRKPSPRTRPWLATVIVSLFAVAVAASAGIGWWYARESPAHQGPIVLISVDGIPAADLPAYGAQRSDTPAIDALAADAVVFDRAYSHSPQTLPAHASILSGRLPLAHGVRDDAGFALAADVQTLPELLRNRGFTTGAAVSTYLLRRESGVAQGFTFFDGELPQEPSVETPAVERQGTLTVEAAERWMEKQDDQRFFLFVQVNEPHADLAVTRLTQVLKQRELYDDATIVLVGDRGDVGSGTSLDERALRVPLLVKQPQREGGGRRIAYPVQHVDLVPTILDLVRAPLPDDLAGRSLRDVLTDADATLPVRPIYAEALSAYYRFGGDPIFAVADGRYRYVRGASEELMPVAPPQDDGAAAGESGEAGRLRTLLDDLVEDSALQRTSRPAPEEEERLALLGYLVNLRLTHQGTVGLDATTQNSLVEAHRDAAILIGQKRYSAGVRALQALADKHSRLAPLQYQIGALLVRTGRLEEAIAVFRRAQELRPDSTDVTLALADALLRTGRADAAGEQADAAITLAKASGAGDLAAAHGMAARVALAGKDGEAARAHARAAQDADPAVPIVHFVNGRLLYDEGLYEEAAAAFEAAVDEVRENGRAIDDLHLYYGEALAELDRYAEAEVQFREELRAFPRNIQAYTSLAMLYRASNRDALVEDVLNELVAATPTPEGYAVAAQLWTILGDRSRAEALRSDARARFRDDPSLALLGRDGRR